MTKSELSAIPGSRWLVHRLLTKSALSRSSKGVTGHAAAERRPIRLDGVRPDPRHISCDTARNRCHNSGYSRVTAKY